MGKFFKKLLVSFVRTGSFLHDTLKNISLRILGEEVKLPVIPCKSSDLIPA